MSSLDIAVIGNCTIAALVDRKAHLVWSCFPRLDGDPVFCSLLDGEAAPAEDLPRKGVFAIDMMGMVACEQRYEENTAVLVTTMRDANGHVLEIVDFAPRFARFERRFRPPQVVRRVRPLVGRPRIRVAVRPTFDYGAVEPRVTRGSNHLRFVGPDQSLRLTTDAPLSYVLEETPFALENTLSFFIGSDEPLGAEIEATAREFHERTVAYWRTWVRSLSIPVDWQEAVIRAAITLKLCSFEETGAVVAALTTSIPEAPGTTRNWDYRFCWLRDAYFVIHALNRLGATQTMEDYLHFIANEVDAFDASGGLHLPPLSTVTRTGSTEERFAEALRGYRGAGTVRVGNAAVDQVQNDGYGAVVLAATRAFFDQRLIRPGNDALFESLELLGRRALAAFEEPDAGPWELRTKAGIHTFSSVMCWAAADRLGHIADALGRDERAAWWRERAERMRGIILDHIWNVELGSFVSTFDGTELDASLLLLPELGFVDGRDPRFVATLEAVERDLKRGDLLIRYAAEDDFGYMSTGFVICAFWYVDALVRVGRKDEARAVFERVLERRNSFGLLAEDADLATGELWGNFPQTYSHVGLINSAMRLSRRWEEVV